MSARRRDSSRTAPKNVPPIQGHHQQRLVTLPDPHVAALLALPLMDRSETQRKETPRCTRGFPAFPEPTRCTGPDGWTEKSWCAHSRRESTCLIAAKNEDLVNPSPTDDQDTRRLSERPLRTATAFVKYRIVEHHHHRLHPCETMLTNEARRANRINAVAG
ncbi:hypothetical protein K3495_g2770 [Podosphaera aphanis]|nr:hypothetical protein K3495_g2770 [Podosphaera aphanis]